MTDGTEDTAAGSELPGASSYDVLPYPSRPYALSHPDRLAVLGLLRGLAPADVERARVLEIGCAEGGNLLPIAFNLPRSTCVGIDLSARQIAAGRRNAASLGLANVELLARDILDFEPAEPFDYVIAHGVLSWVSPDVRARILCAVRRHLAPRGLAYASYNVYPGFRFGRTLRDMMLFHTRHLAAPDERANAAIEFVGFLADAATAAGSEEAARLRGFHARVQARPERVPFLFHEYLEEHNHPLYFHEFAAAAREAGLRHIGDADLPAHDVDNLPAEVADQVRAWSRDPLDVEQYVDFIHDTAFRRSVLCRDDASAAASPDPGAVARLYVSSAAKPAPGAEQRSDTVPARDFVTARGRPFAATHPATAALLDHLSQAWPAAVAFGELAALVPEPRLPEVLLSLFRSGVVDLHPGSLRCCAAAGARPAVSRLARWQARRGGWVTNQLHRPVELDDDAGRFLVPLLDGTRDVAALAAMMEEAVRDGRLRMDYRGKPLREQVNLSEILPEFVRFHLRKMADLGLLVG